MHSNGLFDSFIDCRLMAASRTLVMLLIIICITSSFDKDFDRDLKAKQANILIRQIGHRLLMQSGDSTSRVLPVSEIKEGVFRLSFEKQLVFNPDSLMSLAKNMLPHTKFASGYIVTVHDCLRGGIVYGFMVNHYSPDVLACKGRSQPAGCYSIEFSFPDFYGSPGITDLEDNVTGNNIGYNKEANGEEIFSAREKDKNTIGSIERPESTAPVKDLSKLQGTAANSRSSKANTRSVEYLTIFMIGATLLLVGIGWIFLRSKKNQRLSSGHDQLNECDQDQAIHAVSEPELPSLGKYRFNEKGQYLLLGTEMTSLTDKECRVLELLHKSFGELITRDTLMQEVWLSEGVITGRSLDMFISKLRKKLSGDPELGITNVHGKGYKLEIMRL